MRASKAIDCIRYAADNGYHVTKDGVAYGKRGHPMSTNKLIKGHPSFKIVFTDGTAQSICVHKLQAYQKFQDAMFEEGMVVQHYNKNKLDNSWDNIFIGKKTPKIKVFKGISNSLRGTKNDAGTVEAYARGFTMTKDGYLVDLKGNIKYNKANKNGYIQFNMKHELDGASDYCVYLHKFQAYLKFGEDALKEGVVTRHLDGNKSNNSWDNIAIGTAKDNQDDIPLDDRNVRGGVGKAILTEEDVIHIRDAFMQGASIHKITRDIGKVNISSIRDVLNGKNHYSVQ